MLRQRSILEVLVLCFLTACLLLSGCGKSGSDEGTDATETSTSSDTAQNAALLAQANQGQAVEPVSVETLKAFLPAKLVGMDRGEVYTDTMTIMEVETTEAYAEYAKISGPGDMKLSITDVGNATGPVSMVMTGWVMTEVNKESDTEYEKTTTFQGYKALEEYKNAGPSGTFTVVVANRFVVELSGSRVTMETLKEAMGQVDLKRLAEVK